MKTWLTAVFCCVRAILFPGTKIVIASGIKSQAREVIEKIDDMKKESSNLDREISYISTSNNDPKVDFHNGSWIKVVASNDGARSKRANILIVDEFRMVELSVINKVLRKFLTAPRQPKYLDNPKYKHLKERNKEIYLSSCWYKSHWSWDKVISYYKSMIQNKKYFVCGLPYQLSIVEGLLMKEQVLDEMSEDDFDPIGWQMEMECLFFGENEKSLFKLKDVQRCRTIANPFYPPSDVEIVDKRRKRGGNSYKKLPNEVRIIGVDVAMMSGGDNTIFTCMRIIPNRDTHTKQIVYIESLTGEHSYKQALALKRLFYDFEADYVVMDTNGNGISIYDECTKIIFDTDRGVEYPAWKAMNDEKMADRALDKDALPVIYSIKVVKQEINHEIAMGLKNDLEKRKIHLLISDIEGRNYMLKNKIVNSKSTEEEKRDSLKPYVQTTLLVNELVNLEYKLNNGYVKVIETGDNLKDRYSSLAYANYYANILIKDKLQPKSNLNISKLFNYRQPQIRIM